MQLSGLSYASAPQATGPFHGLPGANENKEPAPKITPILDARNPETQLGSNNSPTGFWRAVQGEPDPNGNIAPPTIMQLKISRILNEQAQDLPQAPVESQAEATGEALDTSAAEPAQTTTEDEAKAPRASGAAPIVLANHHDTPEPVETKPTPSPIDAARPAYEEAASISRSDVLSTLP